jgi:hypothetical protein
LNPQTLVPQASPFFRLKYAEKSRFYAQKSPCIYFTLCYYYAVKDVESAPEWARFFLRCGSLLPEISAKTSKNNLPPIVVFYCIFPGFVLQ